MRFRSVPVFNLEARQAAACIFERELESATQLYCYGLEGAVIFVTATIDE